MTTRLEITGSISSVEGHIFLVQIKSLVVVRGKRNVSKVSRMSMSNILWNPTSQLSTESAKRNRSRTAIKCPKFLMLTINLAKVRQETEYHTRLEKC